MASVETLAPTKHRAVWIDRNGNRQRSKAPYFTSHSAAHAYAREQEANESGDSPDMLFRVWATRWDAERRDNGAVKRSTWANDHSIITSRLVPIWGDVQLRDLTHAEIYEWLTEDLVDDGYSGSYRARIKKVLSSCLSDAQHAGLIPANPCFNIRISTRKRAGRALDYSEFEAIIAAMNAEYRPIYLAKGLTGMRPGEVYGLHWDRVDLESRTILVRDTVSAGRIEALPKDGTERVVPIHRDLMDWLRRNPRPANWREPCGYEHTDPDEPCPGQLVFTGPAGGLLDARNCNTRAWTPARTRAGIDARQYDLRHSWTTWALKGGMPVARVAAILGHSTTWVTENYAHVIGFTQSELDVLDGFGGGRKVRGLVGL